MLRSPTLFEDAVKTILTTNTQWGGTVRMTEALVSLYGAPTPGAASRRAFPTPEQIAKLEVDRLRSEARLGYRAAYVMELAQSVASGALELEALKESSLPHARAARTVIEDQGSRRVRHG